MCNQTVSLVAAALEDQGISTVAVQLLRLITEKVRPPRALLVPFRHDAFTYPDGAGNTQQIYAPEPIAGMLDVGIGLHF